MIKLKDLIENKILVPRRMKERKKRLGQQAAQYIQDYINNGSKGHLDLRETPVETLGNLTSVGGDLYLEDTLIKSLGNLTSV